MTKKVGTTGRFGSRNGRRVREKVAEVEKQSRAKYTCPFCDKEGKVKRVAYGIWKCSSCGKVFTGKAYKPY